MIALILIIAALAFFFLQPDALKTHLQLNKNSDANEPFWGHRYWGGYGYRRYPYRYRYHHYPRYGMYPYYYRPYRYWWW